MCDLHLVARTADGLTHHNTLVLRKLATVVIYLDAWGNTTMLQDSFRLVSEEGLYEQTLERSDSMRRAQQIMLRFTQVFPEGKYSLYHRLAPGVEYPIFQHVPFAVLEENGEDTPEPEDQISLTAIALSPQPELASGDAVLLHQAEDHALDVARYDQNDAIMPKAAESSDSAEPSDTAVA